MKLTKQQNKIFEQFKIFINNEESSMILSGPGGAGKSFLTKNFINHSQYLDLKTCVICPTNKALEVSRNYAENDEIDYFTIASFFQKTPRYNSKGQLTFVSPKKKVVREFDIVFIDECSMIESEDFELFNDLDFKKVYIGDSCQLPPIGDEKSPVFNSVTNIQKLTKIIRSNNEEIKLFNKEIRRFVTRGSYPKLISNDNVKFFKFDNEFRKCITNNFEKDSIILAYTNRMVKMYNAYIRNQKFSN